MFTVAKRSKLQDSTPTYIDRILLACPLVKWGLMERRYEAAAMRVQPHFLPIVSKGTIFRALRASKIFSLVFRTKRLQRKHQMELIRLGGVLTTSRNRPRRPTAPDHQAAASRSAHRALQAVCSPDKPPETHAVHSPISCCSAKLSNDQSGCQGRPVSLSSRR